MKTVYAILYTTYGRLKIAEIPVVKETKALYYLDRNAARETVGFRLRLPKSEEGRNWTTDKTKFAQLKMTYLRDQLEYARIKVSSAQCQVEHLIGAILKVGLGL